MLGGVSNFVRPVLVWFTAALMCAGQVSGLPSLAQDKDGSDSKPNEQSAIWPLPPDGDDLKKRPEVSRIYQYDLEPIADRQPLLLIHGGNGETQQLFRWDKVLDRFSQDEKFRRKYKVFLLRYNSSDSLQKTVPESKSAILDLYNVSGKRPITIVALSLGGNVAQEAIVDPKVDSAVDTILALATPFHGSPLFSSDWLQYSLYKGRLFPIMRVLDSLDYRVYFHRHKNYQHDLKWDDSDSLIPRVGQFHSKLPLGPKGTLTLARDSNPTLAKVNQKDQVNKDKFIVYAGYLVNGFVLDHPPPKWKTILLAPYKFVTTMLPAEFGREQAALRVLNREISGVDTEAPASDRVQRSHMYDLNDGITPVSSAIFLAPEVCRFHPVLHESDLPALAEVVDVRKARVFRNIDHVTFVEGTPPHHGSKLVRDEMHPEEREKEIFDWMLEELVSAPAASTTSESANP